MFTRLGLPMNGYTLKPKRFRAQMPTSTSRQSLKDISYDQNFFAKICRRNFEISELKKNDEIQKEHTHTHTHTSIRRCTLIFPKGCACTSLPSLSQDVHAPVSPPSLSLYICKNGWIQIRPEWNLGKNVSSI